MTGILVLVGGTSVADSVAPSPTPAVSEASTPPTAPSPAPIAPYQFPPLVDEALSDSFFNSLSAIPTDMPKPYKDRCHVQQNLTSTTASCLYGNLNSKSTVILFGDSHALTWFPAIEKLAIAKKWRLLSLTMSSCWPATLPAWNPVTNVLMNNCAIWRKNALKEIALVKPYLTFVAGTRGFATIDSTGAILAGDARTEAWRIGIALTLNAIKKVSKNTVLVSDTPVATSILPGCLGGSPESIMGCTTPVTSAIDTLWLTTERDLAQSLNILWVNPTTWVCNTDPCSPIANETAIYRDGGHLTASFSRQLEAPLWADLSGRLVQ